MDDNEITIVVLINTVTFMFGIFTGFGICLKFNHNLPKLNKKNDIENNGNIITTQYPINSYNSPQINASAPPPSPLPHLSLDNPVIAEESTNQREIIIKN